MNEFKGTKGKWTLYQSKIPSNDKVVTHSVYVGTKRISLCYDLYESDKSKNVEEKTGQANALLISKALDLLEELDKARQIIRSLKLSMLGHPDCTYNSEFGDLTTKAQQSEDEIEKLIKEATEL
jgi:hypothetical protein